MSRCLPGLARGFLSFLVPSACPGCGGRVERDGFLCPGCHRALRRLREAAAALPDIPDLDAPLVLAGVARTLVHRMKYDGDPTAVLWLSRFMERELARILATGIQPDLHPVPLHPARLRERGFNQAERLARHLARRRGLTLRTNLLHRVRWSGALVTLDRAERRRAVEGAFRPRRPLDPGRAIVVIDDVWTTGATLESCRAALRSGGSEGRILFLVAARTPGWGPRLPD